MNWGNTVFAITKLFFDKTDNMDFSSLCQPSLRCSQLAGLWQLKEGFSRRPWQGVSRQGRTEDQWWCLTPRLLLPRVAFLIPILRNSHWSGQEKGARLWSMCDFLFWCLLCHLQQTSEGLSFSLTENRMLYQVQAASPTSLFTVTCYMQWEDDCTHQWNYLDELQVPITLKGILEHTKSHCIS